MLNLIFWGTPLNLKGADGNANVTRYIFPGYDYSTSNISDFEIDVTETAMEESVWKVYLVRNQSDGKRIFPVPGWGAFSDSQYRVRYTISNSAPNKIRVRRVDGPGELYDNVYIIRIEISNAEDLTKQKGDSIIPDHLDISDYEEVAKY